MLDTKTTANARYATHAAGTCTYINRIRFPCSASGGETTSERIALAVRDATASTARIRSPRRAVSAAIMRSAELIRGPLASVLQEMAEQEHADPQEHQIERHQQAQPRPGLSASAGRGQLGGLDPGHQDGRGQRKDQQREHRFSRPGRFRQDAEQAPHGGQPDRAEDEGAGQHERGVTQREVEHGGDDGDHHGFHHEQLERHGRRLAEEDGSLVDRRQQQSLHRTVLALGLIGLTKRQDRGEQDGQPQQAGRRLLEQGATGPEREPERDQERDRERQDRGQGVPPAHLDAQVLPSDGEGLPEEDHRTPAARSSGSNRPPSMNTVRLAAVPLEGSCVASTTVRPSAWAAMITRSTTSFPSFSSPSYGSSSRRSSGDRRSARATATRWRIPWEYPRTRSPAASDRPTSRSTGSIRSASRPNSAEANRRFSLAVRSSYRRVRCVNSSTRRLICSRPVRRSNPNTEPDPYVGESAVATTRSRVDLPAPLGPRTNRTSPRSTRRSARMSAGATPNTLVTPDSRTAGGAVSPGPDRRSASSESGSVREATRP